MADLCATLNAYARAAQQRMNASAWAYFSSGAGDEITLQSSVQAWQNIRLLPHVLQDLRHANTATEVLGRRWSVPLMLAPIAFQRWAHPDGEQASAMAASALGAGMCLSLQSSTHMRDVAAAFEPEASRENGGAPLWQQLYFTGNIDTTLQLATQAAQSGFEAIVLTVDAPVQGVRDQMREIGFHLPKDVTAVHLSNPPNTQYTNVQNGNGMEADNANQSRFCGGIMQHALRWDTTQELIHHIHNTLNMPVLLKGILHPDDAVRAVKIGADGIIVSNHGGRTLDTLLSTPSALQNIHQALSDNRLRQHTSLLVDGGIRRGSDVFKACALGADAVLLGRPYIYALSHAGAQGVAHCIRLFLDELETAQALLGCASLAQAATHLQL